MDLFLRGKSALITGGSRGLGFAIARALAAEGCNLRLVSRTAADLDKARAELQTAHRVAVDTQALDVSSPGAVEALAGRHGDVDILVNNAGDIPNGALDQIDETEWRRAWDVKVFGYINMTRAFLALMRQRRSGVIINIVGMAAERVRAGYAAGSSGNAALLAFTRAIGSTSLDYGVRVLAINPGLIKTERLQARFEADARKEFGDAARWPEIVARLPHVGEPAQVGDLAAYLASDRASFISGAAISVDGGAGVRTP